MRTNHEKSRFRRGFTLVEVLIVIAILLALGGLVVMNLLPQKEQSDIRLQMVQFDTISRALDMFKLDLKRYPREEEGLEALWNKEKIQNDDEKAAWHGPYLADPVTLDNWHHVLIYHYPGSIRGEQYYDIISWGPDGQEGTGDDITNHDRHKNAQGEIEKSGDAFAPPTGGSGSGSSKTGG